MRTKTRSVLLWSLWGLSAAMLTYWLTNQLNGTERQIFLPGATTAGHYQIEVACDACHTQRFAAAEDFQAACEKCHADELEDARDTHPQSKFTDPRNADRVARLDARYCVTCHIEHRPEVTRAMGLTIPEDFCGLCHDDIADERPSHAGFAFSSCAASGCHNFHDNRGIYEDFLLRHADDADQVDNPVLPERNFAAIAALLDGYPKDRYPLTELTGAMADAPSAVIDDADGVVDDWLASAHARQGVNCTACHATAAADWIDDPDEGVCRTCHTNEVAGFVAGRHGMRRDGDRLGVDLPPLRVADARAELKADPLTDTLTCNTCHPAHLYDTAFAATPACEACHDDAHTLAFAGSPHAKPGAGSAVDAGGLLSSPVTCATCHMPRTNVSYQFGAFSHVLVQHNQNANLRPNEKLIRTVCLDCHGLGFSIDALADTALIERNFNGKPHAHVDSIDLAVERRRQVDEARERERAARTSEK